jgi:hypothetical protein
VCGSPASRFSVSRERSRRAMFCDAMRAMPTIMRRLNSPAGVLVSNCSCRLTSLALRHSMISHSRSKSPVRAREPIQLPADDAGEQAGLMVLQEPLELGPANLLERRQIDVLVVVGLGHDWVPALGEPAAVGDLTAGRGLLTALVVRAAVRPWGRRGYGPGWPAPRGGRPAGRWPRRRPGRRAGAGGTRCGPGGRGCR